MGELANQGAQRALTSRKGLAQEFGESDLSPEFRSNGTANPADEDYQRSAAAGFTDWRLRIDGLVENTTELSLSELRSMKSRTQITRHDCVEGWSAIGKWTGVPLSEVLKLARPRPSARYVVFHCADPMDEDGTRYYESIDFDDANHPQTILAYALNGKPLPVANRAPLRVRIERQRGRSRTNGAYETEWQIRFGHYLCLVSRDPMQSGCVQVSLHPSAKITFYLDIGATEGPFTILPGNPGKL